MKVEEAIKKAIEGGWHKDWEITGVELAEHDGGYLPEVVFVSFIDDGTPDIFNRDLYTFLSDPLFWQSLGKALGWQSEVVIECACGRKERKKTYLYHWHRFIGHLADGKTAEEFFKNIQ